MQRMWGGSKRWLTFSVAFIAWLAPLVPSAMGAVTRIGGPGVGPGTFAVPGAVAVDPTGNVYVLDAYRGVLEKFSNTGTFLKSIISANGTALHYPEGLAIDGVGNVFVADTQNQRLIRLDTSLNYVDTIATGTAFVSVAVGGGHQYTLDVTGGHYRVERYTGGAMDASKTFPIGNGAGELAGLDQNAAIHDQIAVDAHGTIYISDADNQRVIELASDFSALAPVLSGLSGYALAVTTDQVGGSTQVYVGDDTYSTGSSVRRYSPDGAQLGALAVGGAHGGLATDTSGNVFDSEGYSGGSVLRIDTTPDPAIRATPQGGLTSQTVSFDGSTSEIDLWGAADYRWDLDGSGSFATDTGTTPSVTRQFNGPGTYPIGLQITGTNGRIGRTTIDYDVGNSGAAFTSPTKGLTGAKITFDASASQLPHSTVADYAWDFDGGSSYAVDGGTSPTITHVFAAPGVYIVQLRVTRVGGRVDTASGQIVIAPAPPPGRVGVLLNGGDYATNNPRVQVGLVWPAGATQALISNNGGFGISGAATTFSLLPTVQWTLKRTGPERLPKIVYVRFLGVSSTINLVTFTDDIILDETPPTIQSASLVGGAARAQASTAAARKPPKLRKYRLRLKAADKLVGLCAVDVSTRKRPGTTTIIKNCHRKGILRLSRVVTVQATARPRYARVRNSAGSWSRWLGVR